MNKKILILTESGDGIGYGHFMRCSAIQEFLFLSGIDTKIILNHLGINQQKFSCDILDWLKNEKILTHEAKEYKTVLVDSYLATQEDFARLQGIFMKVVVVDDYNRIDYKVDLIINPNVFVSDLDYSNQSVQNIAGGKDYVILRKEFRRENTFNISEKINQVCVTVGGSDYRNLLPGLILRVISTLSSANITVIAGNETLQKSLKREFEKIEVLGFLSAERMHIAFSEADLVISACGQTLHELASMGKPTIGICIDVDQEPNQDYYYTTGFLKSKIQFDDFNPIREQLGLFDNFGVRKELYELGPSLINKNGIENISKLLINT